MEIGLTDNMIARQDFVDNEVFDIIRKLNPSDSDIEWSIEKIALVRDSIMSVLVNDIGCCSENDFYPFLEC